MWRFIYLLILALAISGCPSDEKKEEKPQEPATPEKAEPAKPELTQVTEIEPNEKTDQAMDLKESCAVSASLEAAARSPLSRLKRQVTGNYLRGSRLPLL